MNCCNESMTNMTELFGLPATPELEAIFYCKECGNIVYSGSDAVVTQSCQWSHGDLGGPPRTVEPKAEAE